MKLAEEKILFNSNNFISQYKTFKEFKIFA